MTKSFRLALTLMCFALVFPLYAGLQAAADDVSGAWVFVLDTEGGERTVTATFKVDGTTVTGKWAEQIDLAGTFENGTLDFSFPLTLEGLGPGTLALKGKLAGDTITGEWSYSSYSGAFKATRAPAAK